MGVTAVVEVLIVAVVAVNTKGSKYSSTRSRGERSTVNHFGNEIFLWKVTRHVQRNKYRYTCIYVLVLFQMLAVIQNKYI